MRQAVPDMPRLPQLLLRSYSYRLEVRGASAAQWELGLGASSCEYRRSLCSVLVLLFAAVVSAGSLSRAQLPPPRARGSRLTTPCPWARRAIARQRERGVRSNGAAPARPGPVQRWRRRRAHAAAAAAAATAAGHSGSRRKRQLAEAGLLAEQGRRAAAAAAPEPGPPAWAALLWRDAAPSVTLRRLWVPSPASGGLHASAAPQRRLGRWPGRRALWRAWRRWRRRCAAHTRQRASHGRPPSAAAAAWRLRDAGLQRRRQRLGGQHGLVGAQDGRAAGRVL